MNAILEQVNSAGLWFVEFALPMLIQSGVLILILLLADFALRKKVRAVFRYWIWMLVLVKLILPTSLSAPLSLGYFFGNQLAYVDRTEATTETAQTAPAIVSPMINPPRIEAGSDTSAIAPTTPTIEPAVAKLTNPPVAPLSWQGAVFLAWLTVVITMVLLLLQRAIFVRGLIAQAKETNSMMNDTLVHCRERMGVKRKLVLKVSANASSPAVCGLFRPVILVPQNLMSSLNPSQLRAVLLHELAHIKRGDLWVNLAQTVLQIIYFYNPLLWLANCIIRRVREQAVDEIVLVAMGEKAQQYPQTLVNVAKLAFKRPALSLRLIGVVESKSALAGRIKHILNRPMPKRAKLGILGLAVVIIIAAILLPMASCTPGPPSLVIKGTVKDAQTQEPIAGARVFDDGYGPKPNWEQIKADERSEWGAITNSAGEYSFLTWPEHHSIKVQAPGYKAERQSLYDGHFVFNAKDEEIFDFALEPEKASDSSEFKKTLPNGVTVELIGICEHPSEGKQWWKPDGSLLEDRPYDKGNTHSGGRGSKYELAFRIVNLPDSAFGWMIKSKEITLSALSEVGKDGRDVPDITSAVVGFKEKSDKKDIGLGIAVGPWTGFGHHITGGITTTSDGIVFQRAVQDSEGNIVLNIIHNINQSEKSYRVVAIGKNGTEYKAHYSGGVSRPAQPTITETVFKNLKLSEVKEFLFQTRPYEWCEFKNVSLKPNFKTDVQVEVGKAGDKAQIENAIRQLWAAIEANDIEKVAKLGPQGTFAYDNFDITNWILKQAGEKKRILTERSRDLAEPDDIWIRGDEAIALKKMTRFYKDAHVYFFVRLPDSWTLYTMDRRLSTLSVSQDYLFRAWPRTSLDNKVWNEYLQAADLLHKGASRAELARRFSSIGRRYAITRKGRLCAELGILLARMVEKDKSFIEPVDLQSLPTDEQINYYIFKLRDVAEQDIFVPGKIHFLRDYPRMDTPVTALRKMGRDVVPAMIKHLKDRRPTKSVGSLSNGGVVTRNCDVALEIIESIAGRKFDFRTRRGTYLSTASERLRDRIIEDVKQWWQKNKQQSGVQVEEEDEILKRFFNQIDREIGKLKNLYPQLADWNTEKTDAKGLSTGKEISENRLIYNQDVFPGRSPGYKDWCGENGCHIQIARYTGAEGPYMKTRIFPLKKGTMFSVIARVITGNPEVLELEQKINEIIHLAIASAVQESDLQVEPGLAQLRAAFEAQKFAHSRDGFIALVQEIGNKEPESFLIEQLESDNRARRCQAALALVILGDRRGIPAIVRELNDTSYRPTTKIRSDGGQDQKGQIRQDHYYAALLLGISGDKRAVPALIEATRDEEINYQAAISLGQIGDMRAVPALRAMLEKYSNEPFVRLFAGYGLAMLNDEEGLRVVIDTLNNQELHWVDRRHAIRALGELRNKQAVPHLIVALKDDHPNIRVSAARALGAIGDASALLALEQALTDKTETKANTPTTVSKAAAEAIAQIRAEGRKAAVQIEGEEGWGKAVNGVQCRLRTERTLWKMDEVPRFSMDLRNRGERRLQVPELPDCCLVQVDGRWFFITGYEPGKEVGLSTRVLDFLPGQQRTSIPLELSDKWETMLDSEVALGAYVRHDGIMTGPGLRSRLKLTPGKHTIRVSFIVTATGMRVGINPLALLQVVSNPVEIVILPNQKPDVQVEVEKPQSLIFHGLDLTNAPVATKKFTLTEEYPPGSRIYRMRRDITIVHHDYASTVFFISSKNLFYIQHSNPGSGDIFYGPFEGNPVKVLNLQSDVQVEGSNGWGEVVEGLRVRWVHPNEPIVRGTAPVLTMEVENVSSKQIIWECSSGFTWGLNVHGVSPANTLTMLKFRVQVGSGASPEYPGGKTGPEPQPTDHYKLEPEGRIRLSCALPWVLPDSGQYTVNGVVWRRQSKTESLKMGCSSLVLNVVNPTSASNKLAYWGAADTLTGLQLGLSFDLQDRPYHQGELVSFKVYVRNTTNKIIKLVYFGLLGWGPTIFGSNGEIVSLWNPIFGFPVQKQSLSLNPGETQSVGSVFLELKPRPDTRWDGKSVYPRCYLTPGTYRISQKYRFADYPGANWHGELTTGELELTILRKPPDMQVEHGSNAPIGEEGKENKKLQEPNEPTYGGRSLTELIAALSDQDFQTRIKAVYHLGYMGPKAKPAVPVLVDALDEERLRESVLHSLGNIGVGAEEAIPALIKAIAEYAPACRWMAAESLAKIGKAAGPALKEAAKSEDIYLQIWCNAALAKQQGTDSPNLRYLAQLMKNADKRTAGEAVRALTMLGPISKPLVPDLIEAMKHSVVPKKHIASALARIGKDARPAVPELTKMLQDTDLGTRADAIYALSRIGGPDIAPAVPLLIQALKTNDTSITVMASRVRYTAATALGNVGPDARPALPALVIALGDKHEFVRANSAKAIGDIDPTDMQAVPALLKAMKDESGRVRVAAAQTLLKIGPVNKEVILAFIEAANDNWKGVITARETFFSFLGPQHSYVIPDLIRILKTPNERAQRLAIRALGNMGESAAPAMPYIIESMKNSRLEAFASGVLRKLGPKAKAAVPELIKMLGDKRKRSSAASVLEAIGPQAREAIPALQDCLGDKSRVTFARALLAINPKSEKAVQQLVRVAESAYVTGQWSQQPDAHYLLVKYGHEGNNNLQSLIDALENHNSRIRLSAAAYLGNLGAKADEAAESLGKALKDDDPEVRAMVARAILLISVKPSERKVACNILFDLLDGKDFTSHDGLFMAQVRAAGALASFGPLEEWTVPLLIANVQDGSIRTRMAAIKAFGNIGPGAKEAIPYLKRLFKAEDWQIRHSAAQAIEKIDNKTDVQAEREAVDGLQVSITMEKTTFALDEPITVKWQIKNVSQEDKTIIWHKLHYSPVVFEIGKSGEKKHIREDSRRRFISAIPEPPEKLILKPGETKEAIFDLQRFGRDSSAERGTYEVTGLYSPQKASQLADYWLNRPEFKNCFTGQISSAQLKIIITENVVWLQNKLRKGKFWNRLQAARRLSPIIGNEEVLTELEKIYPPENTRHMVWLVDHMAEFGDTSHVPEVLMMYETDGYAPYWDDYGADMLVFLLKWGQERGVRHLSEYLEAHKETTKGTARHMTKRNFLRALTKGSYWYFNFEIGENALPLLILTLVEKTIEGSLTVKSGSEVKVRWCDSAALAIQNMLKHGWGFKLNLSEKERDEIISQMQAELAERAPDFELAGFTVPLQNIDKILVKHRRFCRVDAVKGLIL